MTIEETAGGFDARTERAVAIIRRMYLVEGEREAETVKALHREGFTEYTKAKVKTIRERIRKAAREWESQPSEAARADDLATLVLNILTEQQKNAPRLFVQPGGTLCRKRDEGRGPVEVLEDKK